MYIQRWMLVSVFLLLSTSSVKSDRRRNPCEIDVFDDDIDDQDYICDEIRGPEWPLFRWKMIKAFHESEAARAFINSIPEISEVPAHGPGLCDGYRKQILGFWDRRGRLCWLLKHWVQNVGLMKCKGEVNCYGENTKCAPVGYARIKFLIYCDRLHVPGDGDDDGFRGDVGWDDIPDRIPAGSEPNPPDTSDPDDPPPDDPPPEDTPADDPSPDNPSPDNPINPAGDGPPDDGPPEDGPPDDGPPEDGPPEDGPPSRKRRTPERKSGRLFFVFRYLPQACCCRKCGCKNLKQ